MCKRAHPRSRGENPGRRRRGARAGGSSPLTRGKRPGVRRILRWPGLIPAHAGKTPFRRGARTSTSAHPRSRGENEAGDEKGSTFEGSSPLTRGKLIATPGGFCSHGLIPAHAGKTPKARRRHRPTRAHPRSRGENGLATPSVHEARGSSPLTRGKLRAVRGALVGCGLIPAHAGKTGAARFSIG